MTTTAFAPRPTSSSSSINGSGLRVALVAGTLAQGGAEKQLVYMARALQQSGVEVRVYCLTSGEFYERALVEAGLAPISIGRSGQPVARLWALFRALSSFKPHILQAAHFYANLYVALVGRPAGAMAIGCIRNDTHHEMAANGRWGPWLLKMPPFLFANSEIARRNAARLGVDATRIQIIPNVIDLDVFDAKGDAPGGADLAGPVAAIVCRLAPEKRVDRFLSALVTARSAVPALTGMVVGDGPERQRLEAMAATLGLLPHAVRFLGRRDDIPDLLRSSTLLVSTSDHEGFPNVVLEAMAARRPVVATPSGDVARVVQDGVTGYVVGFDDGDALAGRMAELATDPALCRQFGHAGRQIAEARYGPDRLATNLLTAYGVNARRRSHRAVQEILSSAGVSS